MTAQRAAARSPHALELVFERMAAPAPAPCSLPACFLAQQSVVTNVQETCSPFVRPLSRGYATSLRLVALNTQCCFHTEQGSGPLVCPANTSDVSAKRQASKVYHRKPAIPCTFTLQGTAHTAQIQNFSPGAHVSAKGMNTHCDSSAETICMVCMVQVHALHDAAAKPKAVVVGAGW